MESNTTELQPLNGLSIAAFESRRSSELARMLEKIGATAHVSESMMESTVDNSKPIVDFAHMLITGQIDVMVFLTGVGFEYFLEIATKHIEKQRLLDSLSDMTTVVRGPKPLAAMRKQGIAPTLKADAPNTWREVLTALDQWQPIANLTIGVQEYGKPSVSLLAGLEARGAQVHRLLVYRWDLPEDRQPLIDNARRISAGEIDVAMFTSAQQVIHLLNVAAQQNIRDEVINGLRQTVIASIGPTTTEALNECGISADIEPTTMKMGQLVQAVADRYKTVVDKKRRISLTLSGPQTDATDTNAPWYDSAFMKACRREPTDVTPVWLMRQAGRYMAEYRAVREKTTFLELCRNPQLCSEVMCTAVQKLGVDAAIIFSDLLPILEPMGLELEFVAGDGPVIHNPVRDAGDVDRVIELDNVDSLDFVMQTVTQTRNDLPADMPLIGFAGAPFTLASYAIEGGSSRNYLNTKTIMYRDAGAWRELMERLSRSIVRYLNAQIAAGAQCVQIFDSWAGCLSVADYREFILPHVTSIVQNITPGVPVINFATGNPALLPLLAQSGAAVIGIDWRIELNEAWQTVGHDRAVQGNLDPTVLFGNRETITHHAKRILDHAGSRPGHIFNLGHGILPQTPVDNAIALVDIVHELSQK